MTLDHLTEKSEESKEATDLISKTKDIRDHIESLLVKNPRKDLQDMLNLSSYFACLPKPELAVEKAIHYSDKNKEEVIASSTLSTAIRHHLYDNVLYSNDKGE